jgi:hypothetical protein
MKVETISFVRIRDLFADCDQFLDLFYRHEDAEGYGGMGRGNAAHNLYTMADLEIAINDLANLTPAEEAQRKAVRERLAELRDTFISI